MTGQLGRENFFFIRFRGFEPTSTKLFSQVLTESNVRVHSEGTCVGFRMDQPKCSRSLRRCPGRFFPARRRSSAVTNSDAAPGVDVGHAFTRTRVEVVAGGRASAPEHFPHYIFTPWP